MIKYDTIVVGSGVAGLSCADCLAKAGMKNIALVTEAFMAGTSRNTGSDKQTYYKLSLSTNSNDSVRAMAESFYSGYCMHGDVALIEASYSTRCFMRLVEYGVPFPTNKYGAYVGYKTDHDNTERATSIGPLTSKVMTEKLAKAVENSKVSILDKMQVVELLINDKGVYGVLVIDKNNLSENYGLKLIYADNVVMAVGGQSGVYKESVYPHSQNGATALMIKHKIKMANFSEWQYGIASINFRWNLSGSYQQVIPRYISIDSYGIVREFLDDAYTDKHEMFNHIFLKGYQWPFDYLKIDGSSNIDRLVYREIHKFGRRVYLDYTRNANGFDINVLPNEARRYLQNSDAILPSPIERLKALNPQAIELYKSHGIDLSKDLLEIAVCSQHNNGGVAVDCNWQTEVNGLYCIGEVAGVFGIYRPGGSALNDTQVSSMVASKHIVDKKRMTCINEAEGLSVMKYHQNYIYSHLSDVDNISEVQSYYQNIMSKIAGFVREKSALKTFLNNFDYTKPLDMLSISDVSRIPSLYKAQLNLIAIRELASAILMTNSYTGSRGGALVFENGKIVNEDTKYRDFIAITSGDSIEFVKRREIPSPNDWFEKVLQNYKN